MQTIPELCASLDFSPRTLVEFGACHPLQVRLWPFIERGYNVVLVEANPRLAYCLAHGYNDGDFKDVWPSVPPQPHTYPGFSSFKNVTIHNVAIAEEAKKMKLFEYDASSFISGIQSPAKINNGFIESEHIPYEVDAVTIDHIDDGTIDVLLADVEGSEWFCLKGLISRPKIIILELYGESYLNPYYDRIKDWMIENDYIFTDRDHSDALFVRI